MMNAARNTDSPAALLLAELAATATALQQVFEQAALSQAGADLTPALQALELRLKLEEQVLLPAWRAARLPGAAEAARQVEALRELAFQVARAAPGQRGVSVAALEGMALLHFDEVARLTITARMYTAFDPGHALAEIHAYQARWRAEIGATGSIEDEEADPVGRPPR